MTFDKFRQGSPREQVTWALVTGTFLAQRWDGESKIRLYHIADGGRGFFVEVGHDTTQQRAVVLRSFNDLEALAEYAQGLRLPG